MAIVSRKLYNRKISPELCKYQLCIILSDVSEPLFICSCDYGVRNSWKTAETGFPCESVSLTQWYYKGKKVAGRIHEKTNLSPQFYDNTQRLGSVILDCSTIQSCILDSFFFSCWLFLLGLQRVNRLAVRFLTQNSFWFYQNSRRRADAWWPQNVVIPSTQPTGSAHCCESLHQHIEEQELIVLVQISDWPVNLL